MRYAGDVKPLNSYGDSDGDGGGDGNDNGEYYLQTLSNINITSNQGSGRENIIKSK